MKRWSNQVIATACGVLVLLSMARPVFSQANPDAARQARLAQLAAVERELAALAVNEQRYAADLQRAQESLVGLSAALRDDRGRAFAAKAAHGQATAQVKLTRGQVSRAKAAMRLAEGRVQQITKHLRQLVEVDPSLIAAQEKVDAAREQHDQVREHTLRPVRASADYREAVDAREKAEATLRELRTADPPPSRERVFHASSVLLHRQSAITDMERTVLDRHLSYRTARLARTQAILQYWMRRVTLSTQAFYHPDRLAAMGMVDQARADLHGAETAHAVAEADFKAGKVGYAAAVRQYELTARAYEQTERDRINAQRQLIAIRNRSIALAQQWSFLLRGF